MDRVKSFQPDVIMMDNWIPEEGGVFATKLLKADSVTAAIPVIYFSANSDIVSLAETAGADAYLAKPFDLAMLKMTIDDAIAKNGLTIH